MSGWDPTIGIATRAASLIGQRHDWMVFRMAWCLEVLRECECSVGAINGASHAQAQGLL
jgi:hypothetical protein